MGVSLANKDAKWWMALTPDVISKERGLTPPIYTGALHMTNGKVRSILNFGSRAWCRGAKIEPLCGIVRTVDANFSDDSQCLS